MPKSELCGSVWHSVPTIYFTIFRSLDHNDKWYHATSKINLGAKTRNFFWIILAVNCKIWDLVIGEFNNKSSQECFYQLSPKTTTRTVEFFSELACLPAATWQVQQQSYTSYSTPLLSCTFHMFMKRTLLIIGQVMPGSTTPWHDYPIRWEDLGRRYGRNGVEISLPWSETHFLMHNKAFILLAVTRKVLLRGRVGVRSTENPVFSFCHWVAW